MHGHRKGGRAFEYEVPGSKWAVGAALDQVLCRTVQKRRQAAALQTDCHRRAIQAREYFSRGRSL